MGAPIPVSKGLATIVFTSSGDLEPMVTTFGLDHSSELPEDWPDFIEARLVASGIKVAANMQTGWSIDRVEVDFMTVDGILHYENTTLTAGSNAATSVPTNCAMLVDKRTALGGRKNRGRMYWPPVMLSNANVDRNGNISGTPLGTIRTRFTNFFDGLTLTDGFELFLFHSDGSTPTAIASFFVQGKVATQRRRLR